MLADMVRAFCGEKHYEVYENYPHIICGEGGTETVMTLGIVVPPDGNPFDTLAEFTRYMETQELDGPVLDELEGANFDYSGGPSPVIYFPFARYGGSPRNRHR